MKTPIKLKKRVTKKILPSYELGGFDPFSMALNIGNTIAEPIIQSSVALQQNEYNNAQESLRPVDVNAMGKKGFGQGAGKLWYAGGVGSLVSGLLGRRKARSEAKIFNEQIKKEQFNKDVNTRFSTIPESPTYMPVAKNGGFINGSAGLTLYKGESHKGPNGGILVDEQGNPTGMSNRTPIALTEDKEVSRYDKNTKSTYIYSNKLGFAKPATRIFNYYKLNKDNSEYNYNPELKIAVDKQLDNLTTAQEFAKGTNTSMKDTMSILPQAGKGGYLSSAKAKEMLKDGKPLTKKQREYFQAIANGWKPSKEEGDLLEFHEGGGLPHKHNEYGYLVDDSGKMILTPEGYATNRYGTHVLSPEQMEDRFSNAPREDSKWMKKFKERYKSLSSNSPVLDQMFSPLGGSDVYSKGWTPNNAKSMNTQDVINRVKKGSYNMEDLYQFPFNGSIPESSPNKTTLEIKRPNPIVKLDKTGSTSKTPSVVYAPPAHGEFDQLTIPDVYNPKPQVDKDGRALSGLAKAPTMPSTNNEEEFQPWLSPLGHIASGLGQLADYKAMQGAKPTPVSLPRVGAQRIDLSRQRLINERNAAASRAINTASARGLGMNAGATFANTTAANTGVNRLLGQENLASLEKEQIANAQMAQQADSINAELGAQEGLFNTQQSNAYRARMATMNPVGNLMRTAASYAADNAGYNQKYNTLKMIAPDAEIYEPEGTNILDRLLNTNVSTRLRYKPLFNKK